MSIGRQFLRSLIDTAKLNEWTGHGNMAPLFKGNEVDSADFFAGHVAKYGTFPSIATFKLETGEDLPAAPEPPGYYRDRLKTRHREMELKRVMSEASLLAKGGAPGWADEAWTLVGTTRTDLNQIEHAANLLDFRHAEKAVMTAYHAKQTGLDPGLMLGWKTLDDMSGGLRLGDMTSIAGRPGVGKTWAMLHAALAGYLDAEHEPDNPGSPRMFVSMEMDTLMLAQRVTSMLAKVPFNHLKTGTLTQGNVGGVTSQYEKVEGALKVAHGYKAVARQSG